MTDLLKNVYPLKLPFCGGYNKLVNLVEHMFFREKALYLALNDQHVFFTSDVYKNYNLWSCQKVCEALVYLVDNIFIRFGTKLYR